MKRPQIGNGGTLYFTDPAGIASTTIYNVKVARTNSCFTDSLIQYKTVVLSSGTSPISICPPTSDYCFGIGITNFSFGTINNSTTVLDNNYFDYSCCKQTNVVMGSTYPVSMTTTTGEEVKAWIDYNNDGAFDPVNEVVFTGVSNTSFSGNITIDTTNVFNTFICVISFTGVVNGFLSSRIKSAN